MDGITGSGSPDGYRLLLASDVSLRDGLGLELYDSADEFLAEVFRDDTTGKTTVRIMPGFSLDLDVAEWFLAKARDRLL
jgi:hypothetical protein